MLYTLKDRKNGLTYNFKDYNKNGTWAKEWWLGYKYHKIEKAQEHKTILKQHGFDLEIQEHTKKELKEIPTEKWRTKEQK